MSVCCFICDTPRLQPLETAEQKTYAIEAITSASIRREKPDKRSWRPEKTSEGGAAVAGLSHLSLRSAPPPKRSTTVTRNGPMTGRRDCLGSAAHLIPALRCRLLPPSDTATNKPTRIPDKHLYRHRHHCHCHSSRRSKKYHKLR